MGVQQGLTNQFVLEKEESFAFFFSFFFFKKKKFSCHGTVVEG